MAQAAAALKWGVEQRLEFIEFRLFWEGGVNRADIMEMFDVSVPQASKDLTLYQERAPNNAIYDKSAKRYVASNRFQPCFLKPDPAAYLNQLRSVFEGIIDRSHAWIRQSPSYDAAPTPVRGVNAGILRSVMAAIRMSQAIEIRYQSLSRPEPRWRWIAPHAIGFDGFRWHARAYCETDRTFKDFLLSRMLETRDTRTSEVAPDTDDDWHEFVTLEIGPHPELSETQKKVVALDYGMRGDKAKIRVRKALLYYALKRLGLDTAPAVRRPQDQQIVLLNRGPELAAVGATAVEG
ncbi:transcriptional regulator [Methylosinus sp. R-45379]|uniref:WYL domain-containing protein n=1 Tax=Methylosinus sp. R-45379 TaxID=980563 RepID=UPI0007C8AB0C|nr:WYL domain-containing protein [Methylosinus sp. R-45379]OAI22058.1 transcriptional regulator [Methylosinus sp. R-45379]